MHLALTTGVIIPWQSTMGSPMKQNDIRLQVEIDNLRNESIDEDIELTDSNLED